MNRTIVVVALILAQTFPAAADISGALKDSVKTMAQVKSYHFSMTTAQSSVEGDFVNPGRYHTKIRNVDMIVIGSATYMRMGSSPWKKLPGDLAGNAMDYMKSLNAAKNVTSTDLGMKTVDGQSLHAYTVVGGKMRAPETVYLDSAHRIARVDVGSGGVMRFTRFGESIAIDAPI